jgi:hypothetical protein
MAVDEVQIVSIESLVQRLWSPRDGTFGRRVSPQLVNSLGATYCERNVAR